jgi:hypothetical protein
VKYDGKWLKPFKFLGAKLLGNLGVFKSDSRSGNQVRFEIGGNPDERRLGTPKWNDDRFREYALEHGITPYDVPENPEPLKWEEAIQTESGLNTLMGTVWCGKAIQGSMDLNYTPNSLIGVMTSEGASVSSRENDLNIRNASSRAFLDILNRDL